MNDIPPAVPAPAPKNKLLLVFGGALAAVLVAGLLIALLSSSAGPSSVTEDFLEAARSGDRAKVESLICADHGLGDELTIPQDEGAVTWKINDEQVTGDSARVFLSLTLAKDGRSLTEPGVASLRKQDGKWKVCDMDDE